MVLFVSNVFILGIFGCLLRKVIWFSLCFWGFFFSVFKLEGSGLCWLGKIFYVFFVFVLFFCFFFSILFVEVEIVGCEVLFL